MITTSRLYTFYFKLVKLNSVRLRRLFLIRRIRKRQKATIIFIVSSLAMWKSFDLFQLLYKDPHFKAVLVICPYAKYDEKQKLRSVEELTQYCREFGIPYVNIYNTEKPSAIIKKQLSADINFYPQQYKALYGNGIDSEFFDNKLLCFIPYGFNTFDQGWAFGQRFNNIAWRLFYSSQSDLSSARKYSLNKGDNVRIVGSPTAGDFMKNSFHYPWKLARKKRIIWSPHYSIVDGGYTHRSSFVFLHSFMMRLAKEFQDSIQITFKPHPRLLTELYIHPEWGVQKADAYYQKWADMPNTQLETGSYVDLFMTSDAMIHDCGSFTAEYHYTQNPVMFFTSDLDGVKKQLNELGLAAIDAHYIGSTTADIEHFIEHVVLKGEDPLKSVRKEVFDKYLLPPNGRSAAENIYHDLLTSLGFEK